MKADDVLVPGRSCPLRYRYGASAIAAAPLIETETLYVVGGLYGNVEALDMIEKLVSAEAGKLRVCFNGDFNWLNVDDHSFQVVMSRVLEHDAVLGNVEAELGVEGEDAGCGCAYPDSVDSAAISVPYDHEHWRTRFYDNWPESSEAYISYYLRTMGNLS